MRAIVTALAVCAALAADVHDGRRKLAQIESGRAPRGGRLYFPAVEVNTLAREEAQMRVPRGVRNVRLELGSGGATGYADIDFVQLRQGATGVAPGWLMKNLFGGERSVRVTARMESRGGRARVDVVRVEVSGVPIEGRALDFLIADYVKPLFPAAKVSEWFALDYGVDRLAVSPAGVTVYMRR